MAKGLVVVGAQSMATQRMRQCERIQAVAALTFS